MAVLVDWAVKACTIGTLRSDTIDRSLEYTTVGSLRTASRPHPLQRSEAASMVVAAAAEEEEGQAAAVTDRAPTALVVAAFWAVLKEALAAKVDSRRHK